MARNIKVWTVRVLLIASFVYVGLGIMEFMGLSPTFNALWAERTIPEVCFNCSHGNLVMLREPSNDCVKTKGVNVFAHTLFGAPEVLIMVISSNSNFGRRQRIRHTWGSTEQQNRNKIRIIFVLGTVEDGNKINSVISEAELHGDILLVDRLETPMNRSFLFVDALAWAAKYCPEAKYYFKVNDDMGLVMQNFHTVLKQFNFDNTVGGQCNLNSSKRLQVGRLCDVTSYVMTMTTAQRVYNYSLQAPPFVNDQIRLNYILRHLRVKFEDIPGFYGLENDKSLKEKCDCSVVSFGYSEHLDWDTSTCKESSVRKFPCEKRAISIQNILLTMCSLLFILANVIYYLCLQNTSKI